MTQKRVNTLQKNMVNDCRDDCEKLFPDDERMCDTALNLTDDCTPSSFYIERSAASLEYPVQAFSFREDRVLAKSTNLVNSVLTSLSRA